MNRQDQISLKIALTGDAHVGKRSLIQRETQDSLITKRDTIGIDFKVKYYQIDSIKVKAQLWNGITHAYEKLKFYNELYYKNCEAIGLCFSLNEVQSLNNLEKRIQLIRSINESAGLFLIGCKSDSKHQITEEIIDQFAKKYNLFYYKTSAKQNIGVHEAFKQIVKQALKMRKNQIIQPKQAQKSNQYNQNRYCFLI